MEVGPRRRRWILLGLPLYGLAVAPLAWKLRHFPDTGIDLAVYRAGGEAVVEGTDLYGPAFGPNLHNQLPFTYPPVAALMALVLAGLPVGVMVWAWTGSIYAMFIDVIARLFDGALARLRKMAPVGLAILAGGLAWTTPMADTVFLGQVNMIILLLCVADCLWTRRSRGVAVGIATAIKLTPGLFAVYFAATRQWKALRYAAGTFLALGAVGAVVLPEESRLYWTRLIFDPERTGELDYFGNQNINGFLNRIGAPELWIPLALVVAAFGLWRARIAHRSGAELAAVAIVGLTSVLVSPISWMHHAVWIVPALAAMSVGFRDWKRIVFGLGVVGAYLVRPQLPFIAFNMRQAGRDGAAVFLLENSYVMILALMLCLVPTRARPAASRLEDPHAADAAGGLVPAALLDATGSQ